MSDLRAVDHARQQLWSRSGGHSCVLKGPIDAQGAVTRATFGPCGWENSPSSPTLDELRDYLVCAADHGCTKCVHCSDRALNLLNIVVKAKKDDAGCI